MAAKNVPAPVANSALPAYLQNREKTAKVGNVDSSDLIIPRIKLLQAISPEVETFDEAKSGHFWHTTASISLGTELLFVPILVRKTYVLWAPRNDDRGILARASDGLNWDTPNMEFTVKPKNSPHNVTYKLGKTVRDSVDGSTPLSEFGSSIPGDDRSPPAASLTYEILACFPDHPELGVAVLLNTRSQVKPARDLLSKIDIRPGDHFLQRYKASSVEQQSDDGPFKNLVYTAAGYVDEDQVSNMESLYKRFQDMAFRANDESEEEGGGRRSGGGATDSNKF